MATTTTIIMVTIAGETVASSSERFMALDA